MMEVLLFGIAKDIVGASTLHIDPVKAKTVLELKQYISTEFPKFKTLSSLAIAVNNDYANDATLLKDDDEVAIIPPVSGG